MAFRKPGVIREADGELWILTVIPNEGEFQEGDRCLLGDMEESDFLPDPRDCHTFNRRSHISGWQCGYYVWRKLPLNKGDPNLGEVCP